MPNKPGERKHPPDLGLPLIAATLRPTTYSPCAHPASPKQTPRLPNLYQEVEGRTKGTLRDLPRA